MRSCCTRTMTDVLVRRGHRCSEKEHMITKVEAWATHLSGREHRATGVKWKGVETFQHLLRFLISKTVRAENECGFGFKAPRLWWFISCREQRQELTKYEPRTKPSARTWIEVITSRGTQTCYFPLYTKLRWLKESGACPSHCCSSKEYTGWEGRGGAKGSSLPLLTLYRQWPEQHLFHRIITVPLCIPRRNQPRETVIPWAWTVPTKDPWKAQSAIGGWWNL